MGPVVLAPLVGHPYVRCGFQDALPYAPMRITCACAVCGDVWQHDCQHPERATGWTYRYGSQHAHGDARLQRAFSDAFVREQQRVAMMLRGR